MSFRLFKSALPGFCVVLFSATLLLLTGCGVGVLAGPSSTPGFIINGNVHGGAYPIKGATIRLMETQSNGVWSASTNSYSGTARQLLQTTSDDQGFFTFPDKGWTCDGGQYAYITVTGGHTLTSTNNNVIQVAAIGGCSTTLATRKEIDNVNVFLSELSTVATAYALSDFITIDNTNASTGQQIVNITAPANNNSVTPGCTGTGTALACQHAGLAHAFQNAINLVDQVTYGAGEFPTGTARATLPGNTQATVPQAMINTIGNILQSCVDSGGGSAADLDAYAPGLPGSSTRCGDLFYWTTPPNQSTAPTDTLQAVLNMARFPTNNVDALFNLQPRAVFFTPSLLTDTLNSGSQLISYTVSIFYTGTGLAKDTGMPYPVDVALDGNDNVYVAYSGGSSGTTYGAVNGFGPDGSGLFAGAHQAKIPNPGSIALDANGYAWLSNDALKNGNVYQIKTPSSGGTSGAIGTALTVPNGYAAGVAIDMSNNIWTVRDSTANQSLFRFNAANAYAADTFTVAPFLGAAAKRLFVDYRQNVLGVTSSTNPLGQLLTSGAAQVFLFPYASSSLATTLHTVSLGASGGYGITMSQSDVAYMPLSKEFDTETGYSNGQMAANGAGTFSDMSDTNATYTAPMGVQMDGAGHLFWPDFVNLGQVFWMQPSDPQAISSGTLTSFYPCLPKAGQCAAETASYLRGMAIDSAGSMWYLADNANGMLVQTLGMAAPTYPLTAYARAGTVIQ